MKDIIVSILAILSILSIIGIFSSFLIMIWAGFTLGSKIGLTSLVLAVFFSIFTKAVEEADF